MLATIGTALAAVLFYLLLTAGSGSIGLWSTEEIILSLIVGAMVGIISGRIFFRNENYRGLSPKRWILFFAYLFVLLWEMAKANFDVAARVITGKINPGIVRIDPGLKTDMGIAVLANSITLTPGTLSVEIDEKKNNLFIHWIDMTPACEANMKAGTKRPTCEIVCGAFLKWIRRFAE